MVRTRNAILLGAGVFTGTWRALLVGRVPLVAAGLILMAACRSGYSSPGMPTPSTPGPGIPVTIPAGAAGLTTTAFSPDVADVAVGDTVTWTNTDTVSHTTTSNTNTWNSGTVAPGAKFSVTFPTAGTFPYHCAIHPGMVGSVVVR